jgi:hypothetical protein
MPYSMVPLKIEEIFAASVRDAGIRAENFQAQKTIFGCTSTKTVPQVI